MNSKIASFILISTLIIGLFLSCDNYDDDDFPYAPVSITIDMQNPLYLELQNVSGSVLIPDEGLYDNGVIIFRSGIDEFKAYDMTCPYEVSTTCAVEQDENSIVKVSCSCCESSFELYYGSVSNGPAVYGLHEYRTAYNGDIIQIYN